MKYLTGFLSIFLPDFFLLILLMSFRFCQMFDMNSIAFFASQDPIWYVTQLMHIGIDMLYIFVYFFFFLHFYSHLGHIKSNTFNIKQPRIIYYFMCLFNVCNVWGVGGGKGDWMLETLNFYLVRWWQGYQVTSLRDRHRLVYKTDIIFYIQCSISCFHVLIQ